MERRAADDHVRRLFSIEQSVPFIGSGLNTGAVILKEATWLGGAGGSMSRASGVIKKTVVRKHGARRRRARY